MADVFIWIASLYRGLVNRKVYVMKVRELVEKLEGIDVMQESDVLLYFINEDNFLETKEPEIYVDPSGRVTIS